MCTNCVIMNHTQLDIPQALKILCQNFIHSFAVVALWFNNLSLLICHLAHAMFPHVSVIAREILFSTTTCTW